MDSREFGDPLRYTFDSRDFEIMLTSKHFITKCLLAINMKFYHILTTI